MEVTYTQARADIVAFTQFHANRSNKVRWLTPLVNGFLVLVWLFQLFVVARLFYVWRFAFGHAPFLLRYLWVAHEHTLLLFAFSTLYLAYVLWGQKWLAGRSGPAEAVLSRPRTVSLTPAGVRVVMEGEDSQRTWADMTGVDGDKERVYLYVAPANAIVVPRRAFQSVQEAQAFEAEARAFLSNPLLTQAVNVSAQTANAAPASDVWPPPPTYAPAITADAAAVDPLDTLMADTVEVSYVTRPADLWRSQGRVWRRRPSVLLPLFVPYAVSAFLWVWVLQHVSLLPALALGMVIGVVIALLQAAWIVRTALRKHFAKFPDGRPCRTVLRPDGLFDIMPEGRTTLRWRDVKEVEVANGDVLVRTIAGGGRFVPRSAFGSERERTAFAEAARGFQQSASVNS